MTDKDKWTFERYRLGELSSRERRELESRDDFQSCIAAYDASDREILDNYPAEAFAESILQKLNLQDIGEPDAAADFSTEGLVDEAAPDGHTKGSVIPFPQIRYLVPAAAAALLILSLVFIPNIIKGPGLDNEETLRIKGLEIPETFTSPGLVLYRDSEQGVEVLSDGDSVSEKDLLQVGFYGGNSWWGAILSVDGNGVVTRHWPMTGDAAVPLDSKGEFLLPYSYELDDAPDYEIFLMVYSDASFLLDDAESVISEFDGSQEPSGLKNLNPGGKTGLTVVQLRKDP